LKGAALTIVVVSEQYFWFAQKRCHHDRLHAMKPAASAATTANASLSKCGGKAK
jgi:hypothetical protein